MFADFCLGLFANKCTVTFWCRGTWKILCLVVRSLKGVKNSIPFNLLFFFYTDSSIKFLLLTYKIPHCTLVCDWCCRDLCIYLIWFISSFIVLHAKKKCYTKKYINYLRTKNLLSIQFIDLPQHRHLYVWGVCVSCSNFVHFLFMVKRLTKISWCAVIDSKKK